MFLEFRLKKEEKRKHMWKILMHSRCWAGVHGPFVMSRGSRPSLTVFSWAWLSQGQAWTAPDAAVPSAERANGAPCRRVGLDQLTMRMVFSGIPREHRMETTHRFHCWRIRCKNSALELLTFVFTSVLGWILYMFRCENWVRHFYHLRMLWSLWKLTANALGRMIMPCVCTIYQGTL